MKTILWFRRDLRLEDNKLLSVNAKEALPIFIFDTNILSKLKNDDHRVTFIFQKVIELKNSLRLTGLDLALFFGTPKAVFEYLKSIGFGEVYSSFDYDSYAKERDIEVSKIIDSYSINDCYLLEHKEVLKDDGSPYRVFTPFYKKVQSFFNESNYLRYEPLSKKVMEFDFEHILDFSGAGLIKKPIALDSIGFESSHLGLEKSKESPQKLLKDFKDGVQEYAENRDFLDIDATSKLATHLRFGTISPREIVRTLKEWQSDGLEIEPFFRQLIWREFFAYILYHFPHSEKENFQPLNIKWENDESKLEAWKSGNTGVPIVDAAMRELESTGDMYNRARMITASFLTKDLHIDWRLGEAYFAQKLFDYDAASNVASWQWASSTGTDAQPYFRVFNPYLQSKKFDINGSYIKKYVPELKDVPLQILFDEDKLFSTRIDSYPKPIVRHKIEAQKSIEVFKLAQKEL